MNKEEFMQQKTITRMIEKMRGRRVGGEPAKSTEKNFIHYITRYCAFYGKETMRGFVSPDQIIQERKIDLRDEEEEIKYRHEEIVHKFKRMLDLEEKCPRCGFIAVDPELKKCRKCGSTISDLTGERGSTGRTALAIVAVKALYKRNYVELKEVDSPLITTKIEYKVPTPTEWRELVLPIIGDLIADGDALGKQLKTFIFCAKDCGMGPIDLLNLTGKEETPKYGTIMEQFRRGQSPIYIRMAKGRQKTEGKGVGMFTTFFGPESIEALAEYLSQKPRRLFTMSERTLEKRFVVLTKNVNLEIAKRQRNGEDIPFWSNFVPKACRKYFTAQLKFAKVSLKEEYRMAGNDIVEYMCGHSLKRQQFAYLQEKFRDHPEELAEIYMEGYDALRFFS